REWTRKELAVTNEPTWLADLFLFTSLPENMGAIVPRQLFLAPVWYVPSDDDNPVGLLAYELLQWAKRSFPEWWHKRLVFTMGTISSKRAGYRSQKNSLASS